MLRAVVDTNILIRAIIRPQGSVGPVVRLLRERKYILIYAQPLLEEIIAKLLLPRIRKKYQLTDDDIATILALILLRGDPVGVTGRIDVCRDKKDNFVLEAALEGKANYIVTGDNDLLVLNPFEGIPIVGAAAFLQAIDKD
jgi:putative PIN family toxin of toxin-antitoxin system